MKVRGLRDSEAFKLAMIYASTIYGPVTACVYANPSDSDIDIALELHRSEAEE